MATLIHPKGVKRAATVCGLIFHGDKILKKRSALRFASADKVTRSIVISMDFESGVVIDFGALPSATADLARSLCINKSDLAKKLEHAQLVLPSG